MTVETLRPHEVGAARTRASGGALPPAHLLDHQAGAVHLAARDGDAIVGVLSLFPVDARGTPAPGHWRLDRLVGRGSAVRDALVTGALEHARGQPSSGHGPLTLTAPDAHLAALVAHGFARTPDGPRLALPEEDCPVGGYCPRCIRVLTGVESVRMRPGMYIGGVGPEGLAAMLRDLVSNVVDLHLAGQATRISVALDADGWTVTDDGPGLPLHTLETGQGALEHVMTRLHYRATRDGRSPHTHLGSFATGGLAVLNALSQSLTVTVENSDGRFTQRFGRGRPLSSLKRQGPARGRGVTLTLRPDPQIFGAARLDPGLQRGWLQDAARLNPALSLRFQGRHIDGGDGLPAMVRAMARDAGLRGLLTAEGELNDVRVRLAVGWSHPALPPKTRAFANQGELIDGGSCVDGLEAGLADAAVGGRVAALDVLLMNPRYAGPTRGRLDNPEAAEAVQRVVEAALPTFLAAHPALRRPTAP